MTQEVNHVVARLPTRIVGGIRPTLTFTIEQTGADTAISDGGRFTMIQNFETFLGSVYPSASYLPAFIPSGNWDWEVFNITDHLNGSAAGAPVYSITRVSVGMTGTGVGPDEMAAVVSYRANYPGGSGEVFGPGIHPRARYRGRFYLPIAMGAVTNDSGDGHSKFNPTWVDSVANAFHGFCTPYVNEASTMQPVVWSRARSAVSPITEIWVDDATDTRRKRGPRSTYRKTLGM